MTTSATNTDTKNLRDQLTLAIRVADSGGGCTSFNGTELYSGALSAGVIRPARALQAADSEELCFRVELPDTTGNPFQGASTTVTFTFNATTP